MNKGFETRLAFYRELLAPKLAGRTHVTPSEVFEFMGGNRDRFNANTASAVCAILVGLGARPITANTWSLVGD